MDGFWHFMEVFAICVAALVALAAILIVIVSHLPHSPLKETVKAVSSRVSATAAVALVGLPLQAIPEIDGIYDIGGIILLAIYWYGLINKIQSARTISEKHAHIKEALPVFARIFRNRRR